MAFDPSFLSRRHWLALAGSSALAACGGGGGDGGAPSDEFSLQADRPRYGVGDRAVLTARFAEGQANIEPDIGPVLSGQPVTTPPLAASRSYRLVLRRAGQPDLRRELELQVGWRDRWRTLALPFPVSMHASAVQADGSVLIVGGSRGGSVVSDDVSRLDPATGEVRSVARLASGRSECQAFVLADGQLLVAGGFQALQGGNHAELVDPRSGTVRHAGGLMQPRGRHAAVQLADGRVMLIGGLNRDSAEIWDPATPGWQLLASRLVHSREWATATLLADGRVLVAGGATVNDVYQFAEVFDPRTGLFVPLPLTGLPAQHRLYFHTAHRMGDGSVWVLGGNLQGDDRTPLAQAWRIDVEAGRAQPLSALQRARTLMRSVAVPGDEVFLAGGQVGTAADADASREAAFYAAASPQRVAPPMPDPRAWHTLDRLPDGRLLVVGGEDSEGRISNTALLYD